MRKWDPPHPSVYQKFEDQEEMKKFAQAAEAPSLAEPRAHLSPSSTLSTTMCNAHKPKGGERKGCTGGSTSRRGSGAALRGWYSGRGSWLWVIQAHRLQQLARSCGVFGRAGKARAYLEVSTVLRFSAGYLHFNSISLIGVLEELKRFGLLVQLYTRRASPRCSNKV